MSGANISSFYVLGHIW